MIHDKFCLAGKWLTDPLSFAAVQAANSRPVVESVCICEPLAEARADERKQAGLRVAKASYSRGLAPWRSWGLWGRIMFVWDAVQAARGDGEQNV